MSGETRDEKLAEAARPATVLDDAAETGARRYAEALVNVAAAQGDAESILDNLDQIVDKVMRLHPELGDIFNSPTLAQSDRDRLLMRLYENRVQPTLLNFLRVLNRGHRLDLLPAIARQARESWERRQGRKRVIVRSAAPLDDSQATRLAERLRGLLGAEPILRVEVDPSLIGGLLVQVGDQVYDASIRAQLERLRRQLVHDKLQEVRGELSEAAATP